ncbi:MAG TPA: hypothetical protein VGC30_03625 [Dokdonella sp.]
MKLRTSLSLAAVLFASTALAQTAEPTKNDPVPRPKAPEWTDADSNRDGYLEKDELIPYPGVLKNFEKIDTDGDGRISQDEYAAWRDHD